MSRTPVDLQAGQDYPRDWNQFLDWFSDEDRCLVYLEGLRWPDGFTCHRCGERQEPYRASRGRLMCPQCRYQSTVTSGTVFDKTRTPLRTWFAAAWYITSQKYGASALGMQRVLGLGSYQTAWTMLHRLRRAMVRPGREALSGEVEVDESYVAITDPSKLGKGIKNRSNTTKTLIAIAVELKKPKGFGRIRLRRIANGSEQYLLPFIRETVARGSKVHTDGSPAYRSLSVSGFKHRKTVHLGADDPAHVTMPAVHRVASLVQRWLLGTHQGAVQASQLDYYLDEFTFRFNRRMSRSRGLLFNRLLEQAIAAKPVTYRNIVVRTPKQR